MRLAQFLDHARQEIVSESVTYAAGIPVLGGEAIDTLRDHLPLVLDAIARDLERPQTRAQSIVKSEGRAVTPSGESAAETHGVLRARSGLTIEQLVAEYRVLRSCVLRLWADAHEPGPEAIADTLRFNEAIDQAVAESVTFFSAELERWRNIFLGVLGHDLRGPLHAMLLTAELLSRASDTVDVARHSNMLLRNGRHLETLLNALLDYVKSELGIAMPLHKVQANVAVLCREEVELLRAALPRLRLDFEAGGDTTGLFDAARVREALANLVFNAAQHGTAGTPVAVTLRGHEKTVELSVENDSEPIADEELHNLFEPLRSYSAAAGGASRNLGLGLFIVREIARAHGGDVTVSMAERRINFRLLLPRTAPVA